MLNGIHAKVVTGKESMSNSWKKPLLIMLGIVAVLLAVYFGKSVNEDISITEPMRYASFYTIDEGTVRSTDVPSNNLGTEYITAYKQQDFQKVLDLLSPDLEIASNEIKLVAAISALEVGDHTLAKTQLESITVSDDFFYVDHARWYQALLHLGEGQKDAAVDLLMSLAKNPKADHHEDAVKLLKTIK